MPSTQADAAVYSGVMPETAFTTPTYRGVSGLKIGLRIDPQIKQIFIKNISYFTEQISQIIFSERVTALSLKRQNHNYQNWLKFYSSHKLQRIYE